LIYDIFGDMDAPLYLRDPSMETLFGDTDGLYFLKQGLLIAGDFDKALPSETYAKRYCELYTAVQENLESFVVRPVGH